MIRAQIYSSGESGSWYPRLGERALLGVEFELTVDTDTNECSMNTRNVPVRGYWECRIRSMNFHIAKTNLIPSEYV